MKGRIKKAAKEPYYPDLADFCNRHQVVEASADVKRQEDLMLLGMDPGEAQLIAEAETNKGVLVTGDKKALKLYSKISSRADRSRIQVVCFEQLLLRLHQLRGFDELRRGACKLPEDKMLGTVFSKGEHTTEQHALKGLKSYLDQVRVHSKDILKNLPA